MMEYPNRNDKKTDIRKTDDDIPEIDLSASLEFIGGDEEVLKTMILTFLEDVPDRIEMIEKGLRYDHGKEIKENAHALKGTIGYLQLEKMTAIGKRLNSVAKEERWDEVPELLESLKKYVRSVRAYASDRYDDI